MDPSEKLRKLLIDAGASGIRQRDITHKMRNDMLAEQILKYLRAWRAQGKVQKFVQTHKHAGRPTAIWRATELILDENENAEL